MENILFYYGWLNSFNSATNGWNNANVIADICGNYSMAVFGDGLQDPGHGDYSNTQAIISGIKTTNPNFLIFGYVSVNQSLANFVTKVSQWVTLGVNGIFMDEAGYDFGSASTNGREAFNTKVDFVHSNGMTCFANAWTPADVLGSAYDATFNPYEIKTNLLITDWYLLESFPMDALTDTIDAVDMETVYDRVNNIKAYNGLIKLAGVMAILNSNTANGDKLASFGYQIANKSDADAYGTSDQYYGASSSAVVKWAFDYWENLD